MVLQVELVLVGCHEIAQSVLRLATDCTAEGRSSSPHQLVLVHTKHGYMHPQPVRIHGPERLLGYKTLVCTSQEKHYVSATEFSLLMLCKI
jgi:hypothetical protein